MKKQERYFQDELRRLLISYAIVPALVFALVSGVIFVTVLLYGRYRSVQRENQYVAEELQRVLDGYVGGLEELEQLPDLFAPDSGVREKQRLYETIYRLQNETRYPADFHVFDRDGKEHGEEPPEYLGRKGDANWGIFAAMDRRPGQVVIQLRNGWDSQEGVLAIGKSVEKGGYLVFTISSRQMQPILNQLNTQVIVTDAFGWAYLGNASLFLTENNQVRAALQGDDWFLTVDGKGYLAVRQAVEPGCLMAYSVTSIQNIVTSLVSSGLLMATALLGMSLWLLMASGRVTEKKTADFYQILDVLEQVKQGNLDSAISIRSENEFQVIADACNEMMSGLKEQLEKNQKMAVLVAAAQNKQLESQFNPHFLFNTLENIRYMCKLEPATAERMVFNLSGLLRYSLNGSEAEVTLREDMEHLENYLSILQYRFGERFHCRMEVEPEVLECRIPKLVMQPMIENAVKYGFGKQEKLEVEVKAYRNGDRLMMICRDDGVGMTQELVYELTHLLDQEENSSRHCGLYNIHRRILLLYGYPNGVEIRSTEGYGTTLIVRLPFRREE